MHKEHDQLVVCNPEVMMGKPVIAGTRITVELILEKLAANRPPEEILDSHPSLPPDGIEIAICYAQTLPADHYLARLLQNYRAIRR